ncbi:MAG TPA: 4-hydroxy-3-methylbut-2-enyl diphosphate reductase [Candidatus Sumerlaeota bacterium]|nr:4-hydroxy-3-methylbut-2-enyl diphosphate reductase [Candidatus Sumerlaeota bacterium]HON50240.1 4-hydroxy-3-methylbut-2-enyl diphosphate reductase [Candidatus Sumerlaeota bacterium]HOR63456.1 4-hydroxy-3-methylbut-2-enyl diphosphate reductase [Candidatus Sumerlaeota bacterium]HPL73421.1 4-hydroxy-3-methylbut-2-enyl diphosphate reductase [Candidatus Sumerlaeota bacterium]
MPIIFASTAGFCYGVRRAVKLALNASQKDSAELVTLGPLVHNQQAIDLLKSRGVTIVKKAEDVPKGSRVIIRAHGVTPQVRDMLAAKCSEVYDATCPHVTRAQQIVAQYAADGWAVLIIGDRGHAEVDGLMGHAAGRGYVVENEGDLAALPPLEKVCVVSQTTQEVEHFQKIVALAQNLFSEVKVFNTICNATSRRQSELLEIAKKSDVVIVVGGRESANTKRLAEIAREVGVRTFHIETADELDLAEIKPKDVVGITAGASTPHWVIRNVVETVQEHQLKKQYTPFIQIGIQLLRFFIYSSLLLALSAALLTYASAHMMRQVVQFSEVFLAFLFVFAMHLMNKRLNLPKDERLLYGSQKSFAHYKNAFTALSIICTAGSFALSYFMGSLIFALVFLSGVLGLIYTLTILPSNLPLKIRYRRLMDIPGSKDIFMTGGWGMVVVLIPYLLSAQKNWQGFLFTLGFVFLLVLNRSILLDVRDLEGDIALGKETIPILLGSRGREHFIRAMFALIFAILLIGSIAGALPARAFALALLLPYLLLHYPLSRRQGIYQSLLYDAFLEGQFLLAGLITRFAAL